MITFEKHPIYNDFEDQMRKLDMNIMPDHGDWTDDPNQVTWTGISIEIEDDDGVISWVELPNAFLNPKFCKIVKGDIGDISLIKSFKNEHDNMITVYAEGTIVFNHTTYSMDYSGVGRYTHCYQTIYQPDSGMRLYIDGEHVPASSNLLNIYKEILNFILKCHRLSFGVTQGL